MELLASGNEGTSKSALMRIQAESRDTAEQSCLASMHRWWGSSAQGGVALNAFGCVWESDDVAHSGGLVAADARLLIGSRCRGQSACSPACGTPTARGKTIGPAP